MQVNMIYNIYITDTFRPPPYTHTLDKYTHAHIYIIYMNRQKSMKYFIGKFMVNSQIFSEDKDFYQRR